ncbi:MAG: UvrD-helicase domain-containing protein [bacterium]|nr:UvrD-helicase domain-containing protein [bacterium]
MSDFSFTPEQIEAIRTVDRSVLVSAAAGSGKTAVLAERCAYLVCDAPEEQRCTVDQLAVVTFTENAATEMRSRIRAALQARVRARPGDARLRAQLALLDGAHISTLHAFGLWLLRRWFSHADMAPAAPVLDEHEATLLRAETLERLVEQLYEEDSDLGAGYVRLVSDYGLGEDREIRKFILRLAGFLESLPDPAEWLTRCTRPIDAIFAELFDRLVEDLVTELEGQADYCRRAIAHIDSFLPEYAFYSGLLNEAIVALSDWHAELAPLTGASKSSANPADRSATGAAAELLTRVARRIGEFKLSARGAPRLSKDAPKKDHDRRDQARQLYTHYYEHMLKTRLQRVVGRFSAAEWSAGLEDVSSYVQTITGLVERYARDYAQAKDRAGVLDFGDLERKTYDLLNGSTEVTAILRRSFRYVLVDEFQDINPLQAAIIELISGEPDETLADNLFVVGDVKQSIYRFRLAEPGIFLKRQENLSAADSSGACIHLQRNYRSTSHIIDAINYLFRRLLTRHTGDIDYDANAELRAGKTTEPLTPGVNASVELHLLQRRLSPVSDLEREHIDPTDPTEWSVIEREAYVIAERIRSLVGEAAQDQDGPTHQPGASGSTLKYSDIVVLLRAAAHTAAPLAQRLGALGIPACADVGGELFSAVEVRDVLSLLSVLDNQQQDVPLAAVLRGPILGDPLSEDELLELRMVDGDVPFYEAVPQYAATGASESLRKRLAKILNRIEHHRRAARERPLAETLWGIYHEHGYLAYVGGLLNGSARRANLLQLHQYARQFSTFQKQGLHRFLRFLEALEAEGQGLSASTAASVPADAVRVMSIHRSKGLEFPVVVLADLGRRFNLSDAAGRLIFDRRLGLGLRVIDQGRMIEYPSLAHHLVASRANHHTRAEELRVLYVAMTRAMQQLILVGSAELEPLRRAYALHVGHDDQLPRLTVSTASKPLDWIIPSLATLPDGAVAWRGAADRDPYTGGDERCLTTSAAADVPAGRRPARRRPLQDPDCQTESGSEHSTPPIHDREGASNPGQHPPAAASTFTVHTYDEDEMAGWGPEDSAPGSEDSARRAVATLDPLGPDEPRALDSGPVDEVLHRLDHVYPHLAAASVPAVIAATELRKRYDWLREPDEDPGLTRTIPADPGDDSGERRRSTSSEPRGRSAAAAAGLATHRFLQYLDLSVAPAPAALEAELARLTDAGLIGAAEAEGVDREAIAWFLGTELGNRISGSRADYRREVMFVHRQPASLLDPLVNDSPEGSDNHVLVRGVIDGVLSGGAGLEVIDYKTDRISSAEASNRVRTYSGQMAVYSAAAAELFSRPVDHVWLVFLAPRIILEVFPES